MTKYLLILLTLIGTVAHTYSQQDPEAKKILDKISNQYDSYSSLKAEFVYTMTSRMDESFKEELDGTLYLKGKMFRLSMGGQTIYCDNDNVWIVLEDLNEVQIDDYDPEQLEINPSEIFTSYNEGYLYRMDGQEMIDGKSYTVLELSPEDKDANFFKVKLFVDPATNHIKESRIFDKGGFIYSYKIKKLVPNMSLSDSFFKFNKEDYPNIPDKDIRDMRR